MLAVMSTDCCSMYSYSKLTFHNSTHMSHAFMASGDNHVIDEVTIQKTVSETDFQKGPC
jgi:hypothetical protein